MTESSGNRPPVVAPKIEGKKNFNRKPARHAGLAKKEFVSKVVGLESHTFDVGEAKYAAKYQKSVDAIANHIQKDYKGGPEMAQAIRDLELPVIDVPAYPKTDSRSRAGSRSGVPLEAQRHRGKEENHPTC
jgi:hypothetical protein